MVNGIVYLHDESDECTGDEEYDDLASALDVGTSFTIETLNAPLEYLITGSGSLIGDASIRQGSIIRLEGIGDTFSGNYRIKSATHKIDTSGYRVDFEGFQEIVPEFLNV